MRALGPKLGRLETICLDVGNTLISMDFDWIASELAQLGISCSPSEVERAEAAARPATSAGITAHREDRPEALFLFRFGLILDQLPRRQSDRRAPTRSEILEAVTPRLLRPASGRSLWTRVLPGVPEALTKLGALGLKRVVVSNANGGVAEEIADAGLGHLVDWVIDSQRVGVEKPDPRIFEIALRRASSRPETALHVGDLYDADVRGARAAAVEAILLDPYDDWGDLGCAKARDLSAVTASIVEAKQSSPTPLS